MGDANFRWHYSGMCIQLAEAGIADWPAQMRMTWREWYDIYRRWAHMVEERQNAARNRSS